MLTQFDEPQRFAMRLLGMAEVSDLPLEARWPLTATARLLRLVGAGGLARVTGAKLLVAGMVNDRWCSPGFGELGVAPGPIGRILWLAESRLAIPPAGAG